MSFSQHDLDIKETTEVKKKSFNFAMYGQIWSH